MIPKESGVNPASYEAVGKKILMICYYFPPLTDVGCKRSVAFAKYWKKAGWEPYVLSVKNPDSAYCSLGDEKPPEGIDVTYTYSLFNFYRFFGKINAVFYTLFSLLGIKLRRNYFIEIFCIPDIFIGWIPLAIIKGLQLIRKKNIDLIYLSCSPFSAGIIGWWLKKITGKPLVIDFRDPFGLDYSIYQPHLATVWFRKIIDKWYTGIILNSCDLFTITTKELRQLYIEQFPFIKDKIHTIYNGFDYELLEGIQEQEKYDKFTIIYTGNFYYDIEFEYFFEGLGLLKKSGKINSGNFQFLFYGGDLDRIEKYLSKYDIADLVLVKERIPYREILIETKKSHLQLLRIKQPMITTKLFEGIALNIPFIATIPNGEVNKIIREYSRRSYVITENSSKIISDNMLIALNDNMLRSNNNIDYSVNNVSREKQSYDILRIMSKITNRHQI